MFAVSFCSLFCQKHPPIHRFAVAIVAAKESRLELDLSVSMWARHRNGEIQRFLNRTYKRLVQLECLVFDLILYSFSFKCFVEGTQIRNDDRCIFFCSPPDSCLPHPQNAFRSSIHRISTSMQHWSIRIHSIVLFAFKNFHIIACIKIRV